MKLKRTLAFICALLMAASTFASCSDAASTDTTSTDGETTAVETTTVETSDPNEDELGEYDFNGEEQHFYTRLLLSSFKAALNVAEETGDRLDDAIYMRNRSLEERFNFVFVETTNEGNTDAARTSVLAGDDTYDVITTRTVYAYNYAAENIVIPVQDIAEIDLTKAYWGESLTNELSVLGKKYFAMADFNLTGYDATHILVFNKDMAEDYDLGSLYDTVKDGGWTYDTYEKYGVMVTSDVNGDGVMDTNDRYGYLATPKQILPNFWISADVTSVVKDADDKPVFNIPGNEYFYSIVDRVFEMHYDSGLWMQNQSGTEINADFINMFVNGQSLFADCTFFNTNKLRAMETDFGILPYPKYDESQSEYSSRIEGCDLFCIPTTNKNTEFTGVVLEAMACESRKSVIPAYYDISLQTKISRDNESAEMLDIIFAARKLDWGDTIYCPEIRDGEMRVMFMENDRNLSSKIAAMETLVNNKIASTVDTFGKLE